MLFLIHLRVECGLFSSDCVSDRAIVGAPFLKERLAKARPAKVTPKSFKPDGFNRRNFSDDYRWNHEH